MTESQERKSLVNIAWIPCSLLGWILKISVCTTAGTCILNLGGTDAEMTGCEVRMLDLNRLHSYIEDRLI